MLDIITARLARGVSTDWGSSRRRCRSSKRTSSRPSTTQWVPTIQMSGGSVANSIAGVAALGGTCGYIGKVADDEFGERFRHDLASLGVELDLAVAQARRRRDRALPRLHHPRRAAHDGDVPGRVEQAERRRHQGRPHRALGDHLRRGLPLRPAAGQGVDPQGRQLRPRLRLDGRAVALGHVLREPSPPRLPRPRHERRRRPARQRDRDPLALSVRRLEQAFAALDEIGVLAVVTRGPHGADVAHGHGRRQRAGRARSSTWSTRTARATCSPRAFSTASPSAPTRSRRPNSDHSAPARSSRTSAHGRRPTSKSLASRRDCSVVRCPARRGSRRALACRIVSHLTHMIGDGDAGEQHQRVAADPHDARRPSWMLERSHAAVEPARRHRRRSRGRGSARTSTATRPVKVSTGTAAIT